MQVQTILDQIDLGTIALPEFQRGFVWNRDQVRGLMTSLYRRYPVGSLLVWVTPRDSATMRAGSNGYEGTVELLLDGQQRITTLYGIVRGRPPRAARTGGEQDPGRAAAAPSEAVVEPLPTELTSVPSAPGVSEELDPEISELPGWITEHGLAAPKLHVEIADPEAQVPIVTADLAWPNGVQEGLGEPVAFELHADESILSALNAIGYRAFATVEGLCRYLEAGLHPSSAEEEAAASPPTAAEERFHQAMVNLH